jgi:sugar-specific transcriptional regulator TrmB
MESIRTALNDINLTKGEIDVYLALLELGKSTTGRITKEANISSSKVYEVLQRLNHKGLVSYVIENNKKYYAATPVERILDFLEDKKIKINSNQEKIKKIIPELKKKRNQNKDIPEAIIYRGKKGPLIVLNEIRQAGKEGKEILGFGSDEDNLSQIYPAKHSQIVKESKKFNFKIRVLWGQGYKNPNPNANARYLPRELCIPSRIIVLNKKVFILDFNEPYTTIVIEKVSIANSYKAYFEMLWNTAKK